jgi:hypothetical protein
VFARCHCEGERASRRDRKQIDLLSALRNQGAQRRSEKPTRQSSFEFICFLIIAICNFPASLGDISITLGIPSLVTD